MKAFFVVFDTALEEGQLTREIRKLRAALGQESIEPKRIRYRGDVEHAARQIALDARGAVVVALDDAHALPEESLWFGRLKRELNDIVPSRWPRVIYVTKRPESGAAARILRDPLLRGYVQHDGRGEWIAAAAEEARAVEAEAQEGGPKIPRPAGQPVPDLVGQSLCFSEAIDEARRILRLPYGLISGEIGVGKMFVIRTLWRQMNPQAPLVIVPCGAFHKDYYVDGRRRRFAGGFEALEQLMPYLEEAHQGLLVLHHVDQLPTAIQAGLVAMLPSASGDPDKPTRVSAVDSGGLVEVEARIVATSRRPPEELRETGRLLPSLAGKLRKRHVRIPSLVQRGAGDIRLLCADIAQRLARIGAGPKEVRLDDEALDALGAAEYPNNIRDLRFVLDPALRRCRDGTIRRRDLPADIAKELGHSGRPKLREIVDQCQRMAILNALDEANDSVAEAAKRLGINRGSLHRLMTKLGIATRQRRRSSR